MVTMMMRYRDGVTPSRVGARGVGSRSMGARHPGVLAPVRWVRNTAESAGAWRGLTVSGLPAGSLY